MWDFPINIKILLQVKWCECSHFLEGLFCVHCAEFLLQFFLVPEFGFENVILDLPGL